MAISLVTLLNTLDFHFLQPLPCLSVDDRERIVIESLCKKLRFLQAFLEDSPDNSINCPAWRGLETEIRYVAGEAESKIELELYQLYNEEEAPVEPCESLHQTLQQVTGDIESLQRRIQHIENYRNRSHSVEPPTRNPAIQNIKADSSSKRSTDQPENEMINLESIFIIDYPWRKLRCLQTIILDSPCDSFSPNNILGMPQIRHVYFSPGSLEYLDLPKLVQGNLQTLFWLGLPLRLQTEPDFKGIPNVKELGIYLIMSYDEADEIPSLSRETWDLLPPISLEGLLNLHQLENLKFRCNLNECDNKFLKAFPPNLKKLTLEGTKFSWEDMAIINPLPNLEVLKLRYDAFCGPEWKATGNGFCKLKYLEVNGLSSLKHWSVDADHFPILERIYLRYCLHLVEFPIGFGDINTLQLIHLKSCHSSLVTSAKIFQKERRDLGDDKLVLHEFYTLPKEFIYEDAFA
nr:putative late blight resistance protein homolog R1B-14 isoform X1 [Ipomoea batatas]